MITCKHGHRHPTVNDVICCNAGPPAIEGGGSRADKPLLALGGIYQTDREREAAAAPALLAALVALEEAWIDSDVHPRHGYNSGCARCDAVSDLARTTIAAAKGEV